MKKMRGMKQWMAWATAAAVGAAMTSGMYIPTLTVWGAGSWDGTADTTWYDASETVFVLETPEQLAGLAKLVNEETDTFAGKEVRLGSDIVLNTQADPYAWQQGTSLPDAAWEPIGLLYETPFKGTFDGCGYTVSGLYTVQDNGVAGLFGYAGSGSVICNVTLHNSYIRSNGNFAGGICAYSHGAQVTACHNDSLVNSLYYIAGGIAGVNMYGTVTDCSNTGTVYGAVGAGGVLGEQCAYGSVTGSYNAGSIAAEESSGGICGRSENSTIENCYNIGSVQGGTFAAGIAAYGMGDSRVENCYSAGEIVCTEGVSGGISGDDLSVCANCYYLEETAAGNCATEGIASVSLTHISSSAFAQELGDAFLLSEGENMPVLCWQTQADVPVITEATTTTTATTTTETTTTTATAKSTTTATKATTTSTNATTTKKASTTTKAGTTTAANSTDTTVTATTGSGMQTITIWAVNNVKVLYGEGSTLQLLIDGNTGVPQWATMDHTVATVDANGLVTAVHTGTVTIVATVDGVAASVTLTVAPAEETTTMTTTSTTTTTTTTTVTTVKAFSRGDCNGDQKVDLEDATEVLRYYALTAAGLEASFRTQAQEDMLAFYAADVNRDDQIDLTDATMILRYYAYNAAGLPAVWSMD